MENSPLRIGILFFGKRGGGAKLLLDCLTLQSLNVRYIYTIYVIEANHLIRDIEAQVGTLKSEGFQINLVTVSPLELLLGAKRFMAKSQMSNNQKNVFLMISHRDFRIWRAMSESCRILLIHDLSSHHGDRYPFPFSVSRKIRSGGEFFTFSNFIADEVSRNHGFRPQVIGFPRLQFEPTRFPLKRNILVLGRLKSYQGLSKLREVDIELRKIVDYDFEWTIAGEGKLDQNWLPENVTLINKWLTDEEIRTLVSSSTLQLLPYEEATQSGQIHYANSLGKPVVVTPVGGLVEQVEPYINGIVANSETSLDIARAIAETFDSDWASMDNVQTEKNFIDEIIGSDSID